MADTWEALAARCGATICNDSAEGRMVAEIAIGLCRMVSLAKLMEDRS